jgi:hypothetical protein
MPFCNILHNLLNIVVQSANKMGIRILFQLFGRQGVFVPVEWRLQYNNQHLNEHCGIWNWLLQLTITALPWKCKRLFSVPFSVSAYASWSA